MKKAAMSDMNKTVNKKSFKHKWCILLGIILLMWLGWKGVDRYASVKAKQVVIEDVPLASCRDGVYLASYTMWPVEVTLQLEIKDQRIVSVDLRNHQNGLGEKAEVITIEILRHQSLQVDVISGATISSKCILKAAESALKEAMEHE